jgi:CheY-like chemotaxis protein
MTGAWRAAPRTHAVQFYESDRFLHRAIAAFLAEPLQSGAPMLMVARRHTFEAVAERLTSGHPGASVDLASHIMFVDADAALGGFMDEVTPDPVRFGHRISNLLSRVRQGREDGTIWVYGEMVDVLCKAGEHAAAVRLEELWNEVLDRQQVSLLCGYAIERFDADVKATQLQAICRQHTHVIPTEEFTESPDDRTRLERVALLQQRARAFDRQLTDDRSTSTAPDPALATSTIYVIDDDEGVRRSLARLLASFDLQVRTFPSAEAFLRTVDATSSGCLIVDVQLVGMSGPDLQSRMAAARWSMPVIVMSASDEVEIEREALRLGARAFLRKPFPAEALIDAITRALRPPWMG